MCKTACLDPAWFDSACAIIPKSTEIASAIALIALADFPFLLAIPRWWDAIAAPNLLLWK